MATLGIGPVSRMNPGGGRYSSTTSRRRRAEPPKDPAVTPSYEIEGGAPVGAKKWLKSLFQADAIHLSAGRIAALVGRTRKGGGEEKETAEKEEEVEQSKNSCGPTCVIYRQAVELEERDEVLHREKTAVPPRALYLIPLLMLAVALVFLLTVAVLDAAFGTRSLIALLTLVSR